MPCFRCSTVGFKFTYFFCTVFVPEERESNRERNNNLPLGMRVCKVRGRRIFRDEPADQGRNNLNGTILFYLNNFNRQIALFFVLIKLPTECDMSTCLSIIFKHARTPLSATVSPHIDLSLIINRNHDKKDKALQRPWQHVC